ncbi:MAG TPA: c-type cytochrome [Polyangiaceae bacterium]|jgi:cytochrome c2
MKHFGLIALFTLLVSLMYTGVGQLLPQLENRPPPEVKAGSSIGPEELSEAGAAVFETNCKQCHKIGEPGRGPNLDGVGSRAALRASERAATTGKTYTPSDYLIESLCMPQAYLVQGFGPIMPPQGKALSGGQILAVASFLQTLGADATLKGTDVEPLQRFGCGSAESGGAAAAAAQPVGPPEKIVETFGCVACHNLDSDVKKIGPGLKGLGTRLKRAEIYEAILDPDASVAPGYPKGLMKSTIKGNGFYERMTPEDYAALVDWLAKR